MRTLNIIISDEEYGNLGLKNENPSFSDLIAAISEQLARQNRRKRAELAIKYADSNSGVRCSKGD